jgi:two-component system cell cycle sensor histidine kinase/response regulator CckA
MLDVAAELATGRFRLVYPMNTILILEPHAVALETLSSILELKGYRVLQANNSEAALAACENDQMSVDLLLTDTALREIGGAAAVYQQLQEVRPGLPALFISGYDRSDLIERGWLTSDAVFLQKPFTARDLMAEIERLLSESQARAAEVE